MAYAHESSHREACRLFGGNVTAFEVNPLEKSYISCDIEPSREHALAQSNVDALGYHFMVGFELVALLVWMFGILMVELKAGKR